MLPAIHGIIDRRILLNCTIPPDIVAPLLPKSFRPKLVNGFAIAGVCFIRFKQLRPKGFPKILGLRSENAAHRFAVEWKEDNVWKEGVYIPRRDTSLRFNKIAGGTLFPGKHWLADFKVTETAHTFDISYQSSDQLYVSLKAEKTDIFPTTSVFADLPACSCFFQQGDTGYSPLKNKQEGIQLITPQWKVSPLQVTHFHSSYFTNEKYFPAGSVTLDNALLMQHTYHEWARKESIY